MKPTSCPSCKQNNWLEVDKGSYCQNCDYIINKRKHQINKNILRQDHNFSTRLPYAKKKIRDIWMNMVDTNYDTTEDMNDKVQQIKGQTKLKFFKKINNYYNEMKNKNNQTNYEDFFSRSAQGISKIHHEVIMLMKFLQTKPQVKNMNINYYDLCFTVIRTRDENWDIDSLYENDYISFKDFIIPNHYIGRKNDKEILR